MSSGRIFSRFIFPHLRQQTSSGSARSLGSTVPNRSTGKSDENVILAETAFYNGAMYQGFSSGNASYAAGYGIGFQGFVPTQQIYTQQQQQLRFYSTPSSQSSSLNNSQQHQQQDPQSSAVDAQSQSDTSAAQDTTFESQGQELHQSVTDTYIPPPSTHTTSALEHAEEPSLYETLSRALQAREAHEAWKIYTVMRGSTHADGGALEKNSSTKKNQKNMEELRKMTLNDYNTILRFVRMKPIIQTRMERIAIMESILSEMKSLGISFDITTFVTMMAAYSKIGHVENVKSLIREMEERGLRADTRNNILMDAYIHSGRFNEAEEIFQEIRSERNNPQLTSAYNIMLQAYNREGNHQKVIQLHEQMTKIDRVRPDRNTYDILIDSYSRTHNLTMVDSLINDKLMSGYPATTYQYNSLIRLYKDMKDMSNVISVYHDMIQARMRPDQTTFSYVLEAYAQVGDVQNTLFTYFTLGKYNLVPNVNHFKSLAICFGRNPEAPRLRSALGSVDRRLNARFTVQLLEGYCELEDWDSARHVYNMMKRIFTKSMGVDILNNVLRVYATYKFDTHEVLNVLQTISTMGLTPNAYTYNQVLRSIKTSPTSTAEEKDEVENMRRELVKQCLSVGLNVKETDGLPELVGEIRNIGNGDFKKGIDTVMTEVKEGVSPATEERVAL